MAVRDCEVQLDSGPPQLMEMIDGLFVWSCAAVVTASMKPASVFGAKYVAILAIGLTCGVGRMPARADDQDTKLLEAANKGLETSQSEGLALEASYFGICAATEDKKEGTSAFLEKRPPKFRGR